ncbi:hypothetical protein JCM9279_004239 [Rhodotorula babjevae]
MAPASPGVRPLAVLPLPPRTASLVRSAVVVPSLQSILRELVQNSFDANARTIHCAVDLDTWSIRCDDSGHGIPPLDLRQLAAPWTARTNLTSKHELDHADGPSTYGFRGEALASIRDLATLDIRTRPLARDPGDDGSTWHVVLRDEHCLVLEKAQVERTGPGTTVTVRDIFHKLPVRRRSLAKPAAQAALLSSLRSTLASLALLHPHVAFSLTDTTTSLSSLSSEPRTLVAVARSTEGVVGRWRQLWGRAGIEKVWEFDEVEANGDEREGRLQATGFFSLSAAHSKAGQHVSHAPARPDVNSRPLAASTSILHKLVNALFASSSFAPFAVSHLVTPSPASPARAATTGKNPRRPVERHPTFVIALEVPGRVVDVSLEPEKRVVEFEDPDRVERFLAHLVKRFLTANGFLHAAPVAPHAAAASTSTVAPSPALAPLPTPKRPRRTAPDAAPAEHDLKLAARPAKGLVHRSPPAAPVAHPSLGTSSSAPTDLDVADVVQRWVDPKTGEAWCVDSRTGNSWRAGASAPVGAAATLGGAVEDCDGCGGVRRGRESKVDRSALKRRRDEGEEDEDEVPQWLRDSLESWQNPVFPSAAVARPVPALPPLPTANNLSTSFRLTKRTTLLEKPSHKPIRSSRTTADAFFRTTRPPPGLELPALGPLGTPSSSAAPPVSKEQLARAECIAQVDCKYLLVRVPPPAPSSTAASERALSSAADPGPATLVLIDQHAASERVRVERLYAAVVGAVARGERPPTTPARLLLVVSAAEYGALRDRWRGEFARWGIEVELGAGAGGGALGEGGGGEYRQVELTAVPSAVALRLLSPREPHLAQELVRAFVAQLDEDGPAPSAAAARVGAEGGVGAGSWVAMLRHAPRVLKDLLDSKACRGAVMFNDVLTPTQSSALLAQLAETLFPGQCAHARPSMVPVVRLSARAAKEARARDEEVDWARFG